MPLAALNPVLTEQDIYLFREGTHFRAYEKLGAHPVQGAAATGIGEKGGAGTHFAIWAPNAQRVAVVGDFNGWRPDAHPLTPRPDSSGIWSGFVPGVQQGALYKYHIESRSRGYTVQKADPYGYRCELPPRTASVVWDLSY
jgi:1,4-alpha-glucan branching enzyme